jgi:hypothetical protein
VGKLLKHFLRNLRVNVMTVIRSHVRIILKVRGRISKWVTNWSKTAVMDVVVYLYVSLGSSTVQLHDNLGSRRVCICSEAGFSSQNGDRAWRVYCRRAVFCCAFFCGQKDSVQKTFIKKYFLFTDGSVCRVKRFTTESRNVADFLLTTRLKRLKRRRGSGWDNSQKTSMLRVSTRL